MKHQTKIFSIFGQIESVAAGVMIEKHGCHRIEADKIPETAAISQDGKPALFAVVIPAPKQRIFEDLIRGLRA